MLRFRINNKPRKISLPVDEYAAGPESRINKMRKLVTGLVRHERIEGRLSYVDEARGYAERLIQEAARHGDQHQATMDMADYWLLAVSLPGRQPSIIDWFIGTMKEDKDLIPKLFKVIVPRYSSFDGSFTQVHRLPDSDGKKNLCLELKGNPLPPIIFKTRNVQGSLINVLLNEAKKEYRMKKYKEMAETYNEPKSIFITKQYKTDSSPTNKNESTSATQS